MPKELLDVLYERLGLSAFHIALRCGVGTLAVLNRLRVVGIRVRPSGGESPWTVPTYG